MTLSKKAQALWGGAQEATALGMLACQDCGGFYVMAGGLLHGADPQYCYGCRTKHEVAVSQINQIANEIAKWVRDYWAAYGVNPNLTEETVRQALVTHLRDMGMLKEAE